MSNLTNFINGIPKAELHLHIEGSLEPEMMFNLAKRNGIDLPYYNVEAIRKAYDFSNLQDFLDIYYAGMSVLVTEQDFFELTMAYIERCSQDNVTHVEIFFDPQGHTERGISFETALFGISNALKQGQQKYDISYKVIMCFLRHLSEEEAYETLDLAKTHLSLIDGVGLDSSEVGNPPAKFKNVFNEANSLGLKLVAHAGEEGPPEYVEEALSLLRIHRLDHGNRALESTELVKVLAEKQIALTVCPLSNLKLCVIDEMKNHPILTMLDKGLLATVNSDDPSYFGGYVNDNFNALSENLPLKKEHVIKLAKNSFVGSFLTEPEKQQQLAKIDDFVSQYQEQE